MSFDDLEARLSILMNEDRIDDYQEPLVVERTPEEEDDFMNNLEDRYNRLLEYQLLFSKPTKYSKPVLIASKGRLLLTKKCKKKWCKVKTEEYEGWITTDNLWGNIE